MNCDQSSQVQAYYDNELPAGERETVERHLAECAACSELLGDLRAMSREIGSAQRPMLNAGCQRRLEQAWWAARDRGVLRLAEWLTAAAAAVMVGALLLWSNGKGANPVAEAPSMNMQAEAVLPPTETRDEVASNDVDLAEWIASDLSTEPAHC